MPLKQSEVERGLKTGSLETTKLETPTGLRRMDETLESRLFDRAGVSALNAGGFAARDEIRSGLQQSVTENKKLSRDFNMAYRSALRKGDRMGALQIRMMANREGVSFGGISRAGSARADLIRGEGNALADRALLRGEGEQEDAGEEKDPQKDAVARPKMSDLWWRTRNEAFNIFK